jgi:predicted nucleic acid-binding protein
MAESLASGLLDTSVFIAQESGRPLGTIPLAAAVSVVTLAELQIGVLAATDPEIRAQRLRTLGRVEALFEPLAVDVAVARSFATLAAEARLLGRRPQVQDTWIAATALAYGLPLYTQDADFLGFPGIQIVRV